MYMKHRVIWVKQWSSEPLFHMLNITVRNHKKTKHSNPAVTFQWRNPALLLLPPVVPETVQFWSPGCVNSCDISLLFGYYHHYHSCYEHRLQISGFSESQKKPVTQIHANMHKLAQTHPYNKNLDAHTSYDLRQIHTRCEEKVSQRLWKLQLSW